MKPEMESTSRGRGRRRAVIIALVALALIIVWLMPPAPTAVPAPAWANQAMVRGAYHIHSNRSDGAGTLDEIASAAARAGLQFVIVTDHGDGTRPPEPPAYRDGVLCVDGIELNTNEGHYVALGLGAAPYPLAGSAESVVEDVARLGGFGFVAHADSPRPSLQWRAWNVPFDGLEWLNADSEWRDESFRSLAQALLTYWVRPSATLASLLDRQQPLTAEWDRLAAVRRVPALAGADAHAWLGVREDSDPGTTGWYLPMPGYAASFGVFSTHVVLDRPLSGNAPDDSDRLVSAIREGALFTVIDGLAGPGGFEFTATSGGRTANLGADLALTDTATLRVRLAAPSGATITLLNHGATVKETTGSELSMNVTTPGAYRVEVFLPGHSLPWIVSNPIYVGFERSAGEPVEPVPIQSQVPVAFDQANSESSAGSVTERETTGSGVVWQYRLAGGVAAGQFAAIRFPVSGLSDFTRVRFDVSADRPQRVWVQLRRPGGEDGQRWGRTVYADPTERTVDLRLETFAPIGVTTVAQAPLAEVDSLLIVADTVNTLPGSTGRVRLSNLAVVR